MSLDFNFSTGITRHSDSYPFISPAQFTGALKGKVVLITGASRGIGRATALAFARAGASVAALARTTGSLDTLISEITEKYSTPAIAIPGDLLTQPALEIITKVEKELGKVDILVNNAGIAWTARFDDKDDELETWWRVHQINVRAPLNLIHAVLPSFISRGSGTIITIGSAAADLPFPLVSAYSSSKASIQKAIQILDLELREKGLTNYLIHPGSVNTGLMTREEAVGSGLKEMLEGYSALFVDSPELAADSMVALAVLEGRDERVKVLSGRYWDCNEDLEEILKNTAQIEEKGLYQLRTRKL